MSILSFFSRGMVEDIGELNTFCLKEEDRGSATSQLINLERAAVVIIKLDKHSNYWFSKHVKMCDYGIFIEKSNGISIKLIELKSTNLKQKEVSNKFISAERLCNFFIDIYNEQNDKKTKVCYTKILLYEKKIRSKKYANKN